MSTIAEEIKTMAAPMFTELLMLMEDLTELKASLKRAEEAEALHKRVGERFMAEAVALHEKMAELENGIGERDQRIRDQDKTITDQRMIIEGLLQRNRE